MPAPVCQLLYGTTGLVKVLYCKFKNVLFGDLFGFYVLCEKYYKPITVHYYVADCVSWAPRLTLLDLCTSYTLIMELNSPVCRQLTMHTLGLLPQPTFI